jgi:peptidylprolyl isomerase
MSLITNGHDVKVHYKGTLNDGTEFDNSRNRGNPLSVKVGSGQLIPGFDKALHGMGIGEVKTFTIPSAEAYGDVNDDAIQEYPKTVFPQDFKFEVGTSVQGASPTGQVVMARIISLAETSVVLDHNHPLAGEDLTFEVEIIEYNEDE